MNKKQLTLSICFFLFIFVTSKICTARGNFGSFNKDGGFSIKIDQEYGPLEGFCFGDDYLYAISWEGYLVKIDTTGEIIFTRHTGIGSTLSSFYGAICFEQDTLWVVKRGKIYALDTGGTLLGTTIDFGHLGLPYLRDIGGIIKDTDTFWLVEMWTPLLFQITSEGNLVKHYATSWLDFWSPTIASWEDKIIKITDSHTPSNSFSNTGVFAFDKNNGTVTDAWDIPEDFSGSMYLGISKGQNRLWAAQFDAIDRIFTVHRLFLPGDAPLPDIPTTVWGDFDIVDWAYCPITPAMIEGLYGLGCNERTQQFWFGNGIYDIVGAQETAGRYLSIFHFSHQSRMYDIAVHSDTLWGVHYWMGLSTASVSQIVFKNDSLAYHSHWETGLDQAHGIATDGAHIWVSGRETVNYTGERNNHIIKFDRHGNQLAHFVYPDDDDHNYEDLCWHQDGLWAVTRSLPFGDDVKIQKLDLNSGTALESYNTDWEQPAQHVWANLTSDGSSLVTIATLSSGPFDYYENEHIRILKLQPTSSSPPIAGFTAEPRSGLAPLSVQFTDTSKGQIQSWNWDFDDGTSSTAQNPLHTYTTADTFSISLIVTGPNGADTLTRDNYITVSTPCLLGDVNMDGQITPGDALCAFKIYLNGGITPGDCDTDCALEAGDINCVKNGITPGDALYIFMAYLAGKTPPLDCDPSSLVRNSTVLELSLDQITGNPGEEISLSVKVNNPQKLKSFGFELGYPAELLSFIKISRTNLTENWSALDGKESELGIVTIGGYNAKAISFSKAGLLLKVIFKVREAVEGCGDLRLFNLQDGVTDAAVNSGEFSTFTNGLQLSGDNKVPKTFALEQNYPNPFNMETEIVYQLPEAVHVNLTIYNSLGHKIRTLITRNQSAGRYTVRWDGCDEHGKDVTSGIYVYRLETSKYSNVKKMLLVK